MHSLRRLVILVLMMLIVSLAANAYFLFLVPAPSAPVARTGAGSTEAGTAFDPACVAELAACRQASSAMAFDPWRRALSTPGAPPSTPPPPAPTAAAPDPQTSLCRIAREAMKNQWLEKRDALTAIMAHYLQDTTAQRSDAQKDADRAADAFGLKGRGRIGFEDDFVAVRQRGMAEMANAFQTPPPDWGRLLSNAHALFDNEDALVRQQLGDGALAQYRDSEGEHRMTILSILATYADADWDQTVTR